MISPCARGLPCVSGHYSDKVILIDISPCARGLPVEFGHLYDKVMHYGKSCLELSVMICFVQCLIDDNIDELVIL